MPIHIACGAASFEPAELLAADLGDRCFDEVFAIRIPVFLRDRSEAEIELIRRHLAPEGRLFLAEQPLSADTVPELAERFRESLEGNGNVVAEVRTGASPKPAVCAIAQAT